MYVKSLFYFSYFFYIFERGIKKEGKNKEGDRFWNIPECYIRGNTIKYICIPNEVLSRVQEEEAENPPRSFFLFFNLFILF